MAAEAEMAQLNLRIHKRELHRGKDVEFVLTTMITAAKSRLLSIPSRVTRLLIGKTDFSEIYALVMSEIELALRELSEYDPNAFVKENDQYLASFNGGKPQEKHDCPQAGSGPEAQAAE
jgi:hypothetical protein